MFWGCSGGASRASPRARRHLPGDELDRAHPLRVVLGELPSAGVRRLKLLPLSSSAVATLAEREGADAEQLYRHTAGNPFFVTEVLAAGGGEMPQSVRDAVLARAARLSSAARTAARCGCHRAAAV